MQAMTVIEIGPFRNGWKSLEASGVRGAFDPAKACKGMHLTASRLRANSATIFASPGNSELGTNP